MDESLWRWRWLLWVCLAVVAAAVSWAGQCKVLDLSLQPAVYPLPTNLTLRPRESGWQLNIALQDDQAVPAACVCLNEESSKVETILYDKDCMTGKMIQYYKLKPLQVPHNDWTSLAVDVEDKEVIITPPNGRAVSLKADMSLTHHALQVIRAQGVEVAVGCHVSCPLHTHDSQGVMKKVQEWHHSKLFFSFLPGPSFDNLHYEVNCTTQQEPFSRKADIKPGPGWKKVHLEQRDSRVEVFLDNKLLEALRLPDSCIDPMHIIWMVGDASFAFNCVPEAVHLGGTSTIVTPTDETNTTVTTAGATDTTSTPASGTDTTTTTAGATNNTTMPAGAADTTCPPAPPCLSTGKAIGIGIGILIPPNIIFIIIVILYYRKLRPYRNAETSKGKPDTTKEECERMAKNSDKEEDEEV